MEGQAGTTRERGWSAAGGRSGARPETGGGAHERGKWNLEVRQGYNTNASDVGSDVVIRLAHPVTPSSPAPPLLSSPPRLPTPSITTDAPPRHVSKSIPTTPSIL